MNRLTNKRILLGVTGGIAAYKSADLTRRLQDEGADVRVVMTHSAQEFITPLTMQALSGHPVHLDLLDTETESVMGHIELARWADIILVAPATADFIARYASGHGDDLLTAVCLAAECTMAVAPAMNQAMWAKAATQANVDALRNMGVHTFDPDEGLQACGETGAGRLMDVPDIVTRVSDLFDQGTLAGRHVVITAGPTREAIDPVRFISNHSSGKQGYALAEAALEAGARVTLVSGPTHIPAPERATLVPVESAQDMLDAVMQCAPGADIFIGVAAVADYRPESSADQKLKKQASEGLALSLVQNPDILKTVAGLTENRPFSVGFAAETENLVDYATKKLETKNLDMIIANNVADTSIGFNSDDNETIIITRDGQEPLSKSSKEVVSRKIIATIAERMMQGSEQVA
ncbi:MAG: bifunctional phosphopantothenoylcysteine decarboxylase/phosphopantothenate--cysteine ligase CoaBC [Pseudomonadales bacterium]|nr:bifunctional phosphopantothenoylcysteine decarboxylase/phosphopantothenate--cysteine ligase CoaBC [Pseudomonadales bacterium]MBO6563666.1 bifunctional phosphopantothenoylcysteine decarboxylase/phosphopantothenate--cysteine ligase CoaBC [Pseudomonadales bacterium]MBO6596680.1 bifunctional phosphopantothenoylcysteine decarboxylase/phosphopantothenate--cysteine ligase CoaBC [Pseudomonadales bacterium]MBO6703351.1 bifunctional phosphopantothenoylcysteine decarboxylase/phosphopantothenate--cystein